MRTVIIFLFAFILYSNTFNYSYILDDHDVISNNAITQKGFSGIPEILSTAYRSNYNSKGDDLYRPLSRVLFAVEWEIWPRNASAAHIVNVLLFALLCCLIYTVLFKYLNEPLVPFITAILFASHPIHTEVVANIKSGDEILALIFSLGSLYFIRIYLMKSKPYFLVLSVLSFFLALLSKESAIVFIGVLPLAIYFFIEQNIRRIGMITAFHLIPLIAYLVIRNEIVGGFAAQYIGSTNYISEVEGFLNQRATAVMLLGYYLLILLFPYKLMTDGSFNQFPAVTVADWQFLFPFIIFVTLLVFAIQKLKEKNILSFSVLYFFITVSIVSNVFILIGTNYGERLMFAPSLGICLLISSVIVKIFKSNHTTPGFFQSYKKPILFSLIFVVPYSWKSISRSSDWKDELTLYKKDAASASGSARAQYYLGNQYAVNMPKVSDPSKLHFYASEGISALYRAIDILPQYDEACYSLGQIYMNLNNLDSALKYYRKSAEISPANARFQNNYGDVLFKSDKYREAKERFSLAVEIDPLYTDALTNLGAAYARIGQEWLEAAQEAQLKKNDTLLKQNFEISMTYYDSAIVYLNRSVNLNPGFYLPYYILGIVYQNKSEQERAKYYYSKAEELK